MCLSYRSLVYKPCPCHLAETGDCILCSQLSGKNFCDCVNWKGVCIYQEYVWNGEKAKESRKNYLCSIVDKEQIETNLVIFNIGAPHKLVQDLIHPGSYVFLRSPKSSPYYDTPISIMDVDLEENTIKVAIETKGTKTKYLNGLNSGEKIVLRGPFWNGVFGLKNVYSTKDSTCLLLLRGIGQAPGIPVLKKLYANGNRIITILDKVPYKKSFIDEYLKMYASEVIDCNMLHNGELTPPFLKLIKNYSRDNDIKMIHSAGPDILTYKVLAAVGEDMKVSCCNNSKMCCGEGVCGSCSLRFKGHRVKKTCKLQTDPKNIFEGRRSL